MKKQPVLFIAILFYTYCNASLVVSRNKPYYNIALVGNDSLFRSKTFISLAEAESILGKPAHLKDSTFKITKGLERFVLNYEANYVDSTSKGKIYFTYEKYTDEANPKSIFQTIKHENEKSSLVTEIKDLGDEAILTKDVTNAPFILIRKSKTIYKMKVYSVATDSSLTELFKVAKKIVTSQ